MDLMWRRVDGQRLMTEFAAWLPRAAAAVLVLLALLVIFRLSRSTLRGALRRAGLDSQLVSLLVDKLYRYTLMLAGVVMALDQLGVNVATALAGLGIAGVAVGLAAQDSLANLVAGFVIFTDKPFVVGDWVVVEDHYGEVIDITLRSTRLRTNRNTYVVIPNKKVVDTVLENHSKHGAMRFDVPVSIAYKEDVRQARAVILEALRGVEGIAGRPSPDVVVEELGSSSIDLKVRVWIDEAGSYRPVRHRVLEACKLALDEAGIEIPFPHLQLFLEQVREPVWRDAAELLRRPGPASDG